MVEISKDARVVLQVEADRRHGPDERNTLLLTGWIAVGRNPHHPMVEDEFVRVQKVAFTLPVEQPDEPTDWMDKLAEMLEEVAAWFRTMTDVDPGAFARLPQPIRLNRGDETAEVGILDVPETYIVAPQETV